MSANSDRISALRLMSAFSDAIRSPSLAPLRPAGAHNWRNSVHNVIGFLRLVVCIVEWLAFALDISVPKCAQNLCPCAAGARLIPLLLTQMSLNHVWQQINGSLIEWILISCVEMYCTRVAYTLNISVWIMFLCTRSAAVTIWWRFYRFCARFVWKLRLRRNQINVAIRCTSESPDFSQN